MVRLRRSHTGEAQAIELLKVINDFEFQQDLGFFQCDNAPSNDSYITALLARLQLTRQIFTAKKERRVRCFGHIINLAAKAFILKAGATR